MPDHLKFSAPDQIAGGIQAHDLCRSMQEKIEKVSVPRESCVKEFKRKLLREIEKIVFAGLFGSVTPYPLGLGKE